MKDNSDYVFIEDNNNEKNDDQDKKDREEARKKELERIRKWIEDRRKKAKADSGESVENRPDEEMDEDTEQRKKIEERKAKIRELIEKEMEEKKKNLEKNKTKINSADGFLTCSPDDDKDNPFLSDNNETDSKCNPKKKVTLDVEELLEKKKKDEAIKKQDEEWKKVEKMKQQEQTEKAEKDIKKKGRFYPREVAEQISFEKARIGKFNKSSTDYAKASLRLDYLQKLPWIPEAYETVDVNSAKRMLDQEHFGMESVKNEIIEYIYAMNKMGKVSNETILLTGPPGTGKTTIARQIAKVLGREFFKIPLGGLDGEVFLRGASQQYGSAKPGAIIDALYKTGHRKLVILLDEVDKFSKRHGIADGAAALLDALDHDNAFVDRFMSLPMSMNDIVFIATANDERNIPSALYDRMTVIEIPPYSTDEKIEICNRYLLPKASSEYGIRGALKVEQAVIRQLAEDDYKNAGIRGVEKKIRKICRVASKEMEEKGTKSYKMSEKRAIDQGLISNQQVSIIKEYYAGKTITSGIDYSSGKESLVSIEALFVDRMAEAEIIGRRKELYEDDLTQLQSYIISHRLYHGFNDGKVMEGSFAVNVEKLTYFRYDANQRLAMAFALFSTLTNVILPKRHVVIGDVSLLGAVTSNAMTKNHITNAVKSGAKVYFVPKSMVEKTKKMVAKDEVKVFGISHLRDLKGLFYRLYMLNRINDKINKKASTEQADIDKLLIHETKILSLAKKYDWSMKEAYDKHFSQGIENKNEAEEHLERLIGLSEVKDMVNKIITWKEVSRKRKELGLASKDIGLHMIFTGNPGTGKTTVAKVLGEMLHGKGLTTNDRFIEVTRDDLVGKYIGHTEDKVKNVINQAIGGILYIDEAHSLFVDSENDFGRIVISTLVKEMEENREKIIVIMSGYKKEMSEMIRVNPGLEDRINFKIDFKDYDAVELAEIFNALCDEENFVFTDEDGVLEYIFTEELDSISLTSCHKTV